MPLEKFSGRLPLTTPASRTRRCFVKTAAKIWASLQHYLSTLISADVSHVLWPEEFVDIFISCEFTVTNDQLMQ